MVVGARRAGQIISKTADLLGLSHTTISRVYRERSEKEKVSSERQLCGWKCLVDVRGQRRMNRLVRDDRKATVQTAGGGVMVWGIFSWHTLGLLVPIEYRLNTTVYLSIFAVHVHPFMTTVYTSSDGYFQQDNAPRYKAQIISDWFLEHDNEFTLLKWPPQSPDLNPIEQLWDVVEREIHIMDVQTTNLQQLCDAIMSIWTKISEECFQHLVESMPQRIKAVLKAKGDSTRY